jgi:Fic family protein
MDSPRIGRGLFIIMIVREHDDKRLYDLMQEKNLLRQYDYLLNCIEIGIDQGPNAFDRYFLWALNHIAVANISQFGGRFRAEPIYVGNHIPPHYRDVPDLMDRFVSFVHENWFVLSPTQLAAYGLWRLNWIHPFIEGNGRTARAVSYYLLCVRAGALLGGKKIVPERIRESRAPYLAALRAADLAWNQGHYDLTVMDAYLAQLAQDQMTDAGIASNP